MKKRKKNVQLLEFKPSVRTLAKREGIDITTLLEILRLKRPDQSDTEENFVRGFLDNVPGMLCDDFGNRYMVVGDQPPTTLWSCHTDTVSKDGGFQNVQWDGDILKLHQGRPGDCLGADDGAGLWLLLELIKVNKPGLYIFHRAEEVGGKGSRFFAKKPSIPLDSIKRAIAFDRKNVSSIITKQGGSRTCSDAFAKALAEELNAHEPSFVYKTDSTGVFTDTKSYMDIIPECTNVSVGYFREHGPLETLDVAHLLKLREACLAIDFDALPTERDPTEIEEHWYGGYAGYSSSAYYTTNETPMEKLLHSRRYALAQWLEDQGWTAAALDTELTAFMADLYSVSSDTSSGSKEEPDDCWDAMWCEDCVDHVYTTDFESFLSDGEECPICKGINTWWEPIDEREEVGSVLFA
jgi:hypothetical protein